MTETDQFPDEYRTKLSLIDALKDFNDEARCGILRAVAAFYELAMRQSKASFAGGAGESNSGGLDSHGANADREPIFSGHADLSPKEFLEQKLPHSDVERVACLAYYLTHHRGTPHFRTVDISKLNTDAAQFKFSNTAFAVNNAVRRGLLTSAGKGNKQISAVGERFIAALPDRETAKKVLDRVRFRRDRGKSRSSSQPVRKHELAK